MTQQITDVAPCRKKITVEVPPETVDAAFQQSYGELQQHVQLPGFRKGHAPKKMLQRKFGKHVADDVREKLFQQAFVECIQSNDLSPMGDPDVDLSTLEAQPGQPFSFSAEVDVRPTFDLPDYKGLKLEEKVTPVGDAEVDQELETIRYQFTTHEPTEEPAAENDTIQAKVVITVDGEEWIRQENYRLRCDSDLFFGIRNEEVKTRLQGLKQGDETAFTLPIPDDFFKEEYRGKEAKIDLTVNSVLRANLPEIDDAFAARLGMQDMETLRARLRENIESRHKEESRKGLEDALADALIDQTDFELPAAFLEKQTEATLQQSKQRLAQMGMPADMFDERAEEMRESSAKQTERSIRRMIIFDAIADAEKIEPNEEEIRQHIEAMAQSYQTTPAKIVEQLQESGNGLYAVAASIRDEKVTRFLLDNAEIEQKEVAPDAAEENEENGKADA